MQQLVLQDLASLSHGDHLLDPQLRHWVVKGEPRTSPSIYPEAVDVDVVNQDDPSWTDVLTDFSFTGWSFVSDRDGHT